MATKTLNRFAALLAVSVLSLGVAGCAGGRSSMTTGSISNGKSVERMSEGELRDSLSDLGRRYTRDTKNKAVAMRYAQALQMSGRNEQSLAVMRKLAIDLPKDREVLAAYGKALAAGGQFEQALDAVRRAQTPEYPDWKLLSAEASIVDQLGDRDTARTLFRKALDLKPNEPSILSNLGMSYLMEGDLRAAETHMRNAAQMPGADSRVRQNLALVVGLQGRFAEAEQIASQELAPAQAQANVAYLRQMLAQQNAWNDLKKDEKEKKNTN
ncbi:MAG: tetratricopeptide repeat protein [Mesorhizobium sp.]